MAAAVVARPEEMRRASREARRSGRQVALVPTMGALHDGHLSLVRIARARADVVVMSIFVNPTQFAAGEDFETYPRDLARDLRLAERAGVDVLFHPEADDLYPPGDATRVEVAALAQGLCGRSRPGHFRGVATVVAKLLRICEPDVAVFGRKDYQQWRIVERMARDLFLDVDIVGAPIVREPDGLAMSSRNVYLSADERRAALALPRALDAGCAAVAAGERDAAAVRERMAAVVAAEPGVRADYVEAVDAGGLAPLARLSGDVLIAGAILVGGTRLIDNREVQVAEERALEEGR